MHADTSYVLYTYKQNNWNVESSYPEEQQALFEARLMFDEDVYVGVKIIKETQCETSGEAQSKVIFQKIKKPDAKATRKHPSPTTELDVKSEGLSAFLNAPIARILIILSLTMVVGAGVMVYIRALARGM